MANRDEISRRDRTPAYALLVAGVPVIYTSAGTISRQYTINGSATDYEVRRSIIPNTGLSFSRELNDDDNLVEARPVTVDLSFDSSSPDPFTADKVFGRHGVAGADVSITLQAGQSIAQTDGPDVAVLVDGPADAFSVGDVVHIGREAFSVSAVNAGASEITLSDRGQLGTQVSDHVYDEDTRVRPFVTSPAVYFTGRRAVILEASELEDGTVTPWVERWRGFISQEPAFGTRGAHAVRVTIAPLTALLDQPLGPVNLRENRFHTRVHAFGGPGVPGQSARALTACAFDVAEETSQGFISMMPPTFNSEATPPPIPNVANLSALPVVDTSPHSEVAGLAELPEGHPRTFPVLPNSGEQDVFTVNGYAMALPGVPEVGPVLDVGLVGVGAAVADTVPTQQQALGTEHSYVDVITMNTRTKTIAGQVRSVRTVEWRHRELVDLEAFGVDGVWPQLFSWPQRLLEVFNDPEVGLNVRSSKSPEGGLTTSTLDLSTNEIIAGITPGVRGRVLYHVNNDFDRQRMAEDGDEDWTGYSWQGTTRKERDPGLLLPSEVFALSGDDGTRTLELVTGGDGRAAGRISTRVATAFYSRGEGYLTLERPVTVPAAGLYYEAIREGDDEPLGIFKILNVSERTVDGQTAYVCQLADTMNHTPGGGRGNQGMMPTVAQYDPNGSDRVIFRPASVFVGVPVGRLLLQILTSSGGAGVNSPQHDVLAYGAGLNAVDSQGLGSDIDTASFLRVESMLSDASFSARWREGDSVLDVVGGILRTCGYVLDIRTDEQGRCRLSAVPLGTPNAVDVVAAVGVADIAESPTPSTKTSTRIRNSFNIKANYTTEGEPGFDRSIKDAVSIDLFQKEENLPIDLVGVHLQDGPEAIDDLLPLFSRLREDNAYPRRQYEMSIRAGLAALCKVGGTYSITHPQLRGASGEGALSVLCRLRSVSGNGWEPVARAVFDVFQSSGSGWSASMLVELVVDANTVQVSQQVYAPEEHPATGQPVTDVDGFASVTSGEFVMCWNAGGEALIHKITSVDAGNRTITFTQAHGLNAGARISPAPQSTAAVQHQPFAFLDSTVVT